MNNNSGKNHAHYSDCTHLIIRWQKHQEYYIVRMYQDLVGDWVVTQSWGNNAEHRRACSQTVSQSYQDARLIVREIRKQLKSKGFRHVVRKETQLGFTFEHEPSDEINAQQL